VLIRRRASIGYRRLNAALVGDAGDLGGGGLVENPTRELRFSLASFSPIVSKNNVLTFQVAGRNIGAASHDKT